MADNKKQKGEDKNQLGLTVKKDENFSEWYTQVIQKAELVEYTDVSGCVVFRPGSYEIWEKIQNYLDQKFKALGVRNAYFPLFIPESYFQKEQDHIEGFAPEVAWVTHAGNSPLAERLAIRPTSETIMYASYSKWIKSHRDLPLLINQWCSVVRWDFKHPVPFLRTREFLWQEGHTAHATKEGADNEVMAILDIYANAFEEIFAIPVLKGKKSEKEKFAGADYTTSLECFLPNGKAIQGCTSHALGQNFAKPFDIKFLDENSEWSYVWQNSWGFTTRSIGIMIMMHSDDKGLVVPPKLARRKAVIVPIIFEKTKDAVISKAKELAESLLEFDVFVDEREECSPGFKFNEWELKGIPIRIELGPKDLEKEHVVFVRRDTGEKKFVKWTDLKVTIEKELDAMHDNLLQNAKKVLDENVVETRDFDELLKGIKSKKMVKTFWCGEGECEELIKDKTGGAKTLNTPFNQPKVEGKCVHCDKPAKCLVYFAKSY